MTGGVSSRSSGRHTRLRPSALLDLKPFDRAGRAVLVISLALALSACLSGAGPTATSGTQPPRVSVSGSVTAGPTCPVERAGHPCPPTPVHGIVVATFVGSAKETNARIEAGGRYAITLLPGRYTFSVLDTGGEWPRCPSLPVTLKAGPPVRVDIACDTGIR